MANIFEHIEYPKAFWPNIQAIFENIEKSKKSVRAAFRLDKHHHAFYYMKGLRNLLRSEEQLNAICSSFDITRDELKKWVDEMYQTMKAYEEKEREKKK